MICWTPPPSPCEPLDRFLHEFAYVRIVGTQVCGLDEEGREIGGCPIYIRENFITTADGPDACLPFEPAVPGVGEVLLMKVTGFDKAGNPDDGKICS
jgi:hypothetical protein